MKFIIGLGNPGRKYSATRHNIGFTILDNFAKNKSLQWKEYKDLAEISVTDDLILVKPMLFMNNSGSAVLPLVKKYDPNYSGIIVIHDDLDVNFGRIRIKKGGSSGGHNGVQSIIERLGTDEFIRMKIGIGRPDCGLDGADFVLSKFNSEETKQIKSIILCAADAVSVLVEDGIQKAMNLFNKR